jgi:16S rRNA (cytidine1402-2'-O)-methyltransferase
LSGKLLVVATPIGNLNDLSARVKTCLEECDLVLAEDTRVSIRILNHLKIKKRMLSCHDFNEASRLALIAEASQSNQTIALLSDAGTPLISDPGYQIVQQAIASNMQIITIPGPSAFLLRAFCQTKPALPNKNWKSWLATRVL